MAFFSLRIEPRPNGSLRISFEVADVLRYKMGRPTGLEPATPRFTILCSNQLSYDRRKFRNGNLPARRKACQPVSRLCDPKAARGSPSVHAPAASHHLQHCARQGAHTDPGTYVLAQATAKPEAHRPFAGTLGADLVALQEIDECSVWSGSFDHLDYLRAHAGFPHAAFGINNRRSGLVNLCYGNAILSRLPISRRRRSCLGGGGWGRRGSSSLRSTSAAGSLPLVNLHLHFGSRRRRLLQLDLLVTWLRAKERERGAAWAVPPVVCGDFNTPDTSDDATASLLSHLCDYGDYRLHPLMGPTFPSPLPSRALDFVFVPPGCRGVRSEVVRWFLSDHRPVMVEFSVA